MNKSTQKYLGSIGPYTQKTARIADIDDNLYLRVKKIPRYVRNEIKEFYSAHKGTIKNAIGFGALVSFTTASCACAGYLLSMNDRPGDRFFTVMILTFSGLCGGVAICCDLGRERRLNF